MCTVACLGPEGTFSHQLALEVFPGCKVVAVATLVEVVKCTAQQEVHKGFLPMYNNNHKSIAEVQNALFEHPTLFIHNLNPHRIRHNLMGRGTVSDIRKIISKNVVFSQVQDWLKANLSSEVDLLHATSTAKAVEEVSKAMTLSWARLAHRWRQSCMACLFWLMTFKQSLI